MRVVAARFSEPGQASAARDLLERELDQPDVAVARLAHPGEPVAGDALLAGRFPDEVAQTAVELVQSAGGEIVADIDESWTGMITSTTLEDPRASGGNTQSRAYLR
jgi:hypothetical protein